MTNDSTPPHSLADYPIHLGPNGTASSEPRFTGEMDWYQGYGSRHSADGIEARLVSMHTFDSSWSVWEMHPLGAEVVVVTAGTMTLIQETEAGEEQRLTLEQGDYAINSPGVWHTADASSPVTALFITSGMGTEHRPR